METVECGICGEAVMKKYIDILNNIFALHDIPSRELLLVVFLLI